MAIALPWKRTAATPACENGECAPTRGKKRSVFMMALLCAHCSLTLLVPILALGLTVGGAYLGLPLTWIVPPFLIGGAFLFLIWPSIQGSWAKLRQPAIDINSKEPQG